MDPDMQLRSYRPFDLDKTYQIWNSYFRNEFEFPDFLDRFYCSFVIEENEEIVVVGGVRPIAELVAVTNKSLSPRIRVEALKELMGAAKFTCFANSYDQLHCFVQGDIWARQVQSVHFRPTKGQSLVIDV